jgi:hypothetical protein
VNRMDESGAKLLWWFLCACLGQNVQAKAHPHTVPVQRLFLLLFHYDRTSEKMTLGIAIAILPELDSQLFTLNEVFRDRDPGNTLNSPLVSPM